MVLQWVSESEALRRYLPTPLKILFHKFFLLVIELFIKSTWLGYSFHLLTVLLPMSFLSTCEAYVVVDVLVWRLDLLDFSLLEVRKLPKTSSTRFEWSSSFR